jgi:hypothetical protein
MLRSSRLVGRHGGTAPRDIGAKIHALAARCTLRWAADPRVAAGPLRRALQDVLAADALTPPVSEALKVDYLATINAVEEMSHFEQMQIDFGGRMLPLLGGRREGVLDRLLPWPAVRLPAQRLRLGAGNELERSRRAFRLLYANWLAQVNRSAGHRARWAIRKGYWIYDHDPSTPVATRAVEPEFLAGVLDRLEVTGIWTRQGYDPPTPLDPPPPPWEDRGVLGRERRRRSVLIVRLAAEVYHRERGAAPATAGGLLGTVLKELPEGIGADDPIPAGLD